MGKIIGVDAAKLAGLQIDMLQKMRDGQMTIEQMEWFLGQKKEEREWLLKNNGESKNPHFRIIRGFSFCVPTDFNSSVFVRDFLLKKDSECELVAFSRSFLEEDSSTVSALIPGHEVEVTAYKLSRKVSPEDCAAFIIAKKGLFVGILGILLFLEVSKTEVPRGLAIFSLERMDTYMTSYIPVLFVYRDKFNYHLSISQFNHVVYEDSCILVFRDLTEIGEE